MRVYIIDFDNTLFDTHPFVIDFKQVLINAEISKDGVEKSYRDSMVWDTDGNGIGYSFLKQVEILLSMGYTIDSDELLNQLEATIKPTYLYPDAVVFLQMLYKDSSSKIVLLTAGDESFQKMKVSKTGISTFFDEIVYVESDKRLYVESQVQQGNDIFFINDNVHENIQIRQHFPTVQICTKLNPRKYTCEQIYDEGFACFANLNEILTYVSN